MSGFVVSGTVRGAPAEVRWENDVFVLDSTGDVELLVRAGAEVTTSPTGPAYVAAASPGHVALAVALSVFDPGARVRGDAAPELLRELEGDLRVPEGATP